MNEIIRNLAIAALFIVLGLSGFPQAVQQEESPAVQPVVVCMSASAFRRWRILV